MLIGLATGALVLAVLVCELNRPKLAAATSRLRVRWTAHRAAGSPAPVGFDPGRERRAELRARALLSSCVNADEWAMYRDLGFLRVWGRAGGHYAYLIYPHKPLLAYIPSTGALLNEYCVAFPDRSRPYGSTRLPDSDDVLAKWMALQADERGLIADANMHLPGRQLDPQRVRRDLQRLARWERERVGPRAETVSERARERARAKLDISVRRRAHARSSGVVAHGGLARAVDRSGAVERSGVVERSGGVDRSGLAIVNGSDVAADSARAA
ncbi:MAG TPA: hypothetical protein VMB51_05980 [Solirubrobacteraceae bacterium]|nr:hypothetical protein [Solirubrobacteraceae bacterium]